VKNQTTLFWNAVWYFANVDLPFERAELNRVVMNYEETMSKEVHLIQTDQRTLFQRLRQTMPPKKDVKQEGKTFQVVNVSVNGLRRNLQGWPSRIHPHRTLYAQFDSRCEEDKLALATLNEVREAVIAEDLQTAVRVNCHFFFFFLSLQTFLKARTKFPNKPPFTVFYQSCYDHIVAVQLNVNPRLEELEFSQK
jgi:hypothetical protein